MEGGIDRYAGDCEVRRSWRRVVRDDGSSSSIGAKTRTPKRGKDSLASSRMPQLGDINFLELIRSICTEGSVFEDVVLFPS